VSKVVNGRTGISAETRALVEAAIAELGYVSIGERQSSLHASQEMSIELVVDPQDVGNPYLSTFLGGAMEAATDLGVALVLRDLHSGPAQDPAAWAQHAASAGRAGVIEVTSAFSRTREKAVKRSGLAMVLVDPIDLPRLTTPSIGATNWAGAYEATQHLIGLGHTRIRYIGGPPGAHCDVVRAHGWAAAMTEAGLEADLAAIPRHSYTFDHGLAVGKEMLSGANRPTAVFAGSDTIAAGVLEAARQVGLTVPTGLSVVGFDNTLLAQMSTPPLTTVHQPIADIGRTAVSTVVRIARGEAMETKRIELSTHLVVRESTAPPMD
jgi:LacI family transcriptional regulator